MSESPNDLPPVRFPKTDPWSGLSQQDVVPQGRPLTYGERDVLRAFLRFRDSAPPQRWLLLRGVVHGTAMLVVFGILTGLLCVGFYSIFPLASEGTNYDPETDAPSGWEGLFALAIWLGLAYGFLVRDQIDLRRTVAAWRLVQRVIKFDTADRILQSGVLSPAPDEQDVTRTQT